MGRGASGGRENGGDDGKIARLPGVRARAGASTLQSETEARVFFRHYWPIIIASLASLAWLGVAGWWVAGRLPEGGVADLNLGEAAGLVSGIVSPLVIVWLAALVYLRTDPLRGYRLDLAHALDELLSPVDAAESRVDGLVARLKRQIEHLEAASDIASDRLGHLERRFQGQIGDLFTATTGAEKAAETITFRLSAERQSLNDVRRQIEATAQGSLEGLAELRRDLRETAATARQDAAAAGESLRAEARTLSEVIKEAVAETGGLAGRLESLTGTIRSVLNETSEGIGALSNAANDAEARLVARMAGMERETSRLCQLLGERGRALEEEAKRRAADLQATAETFAATATHARDEANATISRIDAGREALLGAISTLSDALQTFEGVIGAAAKTLADNDDHLQSSRALVGAMRNDIADALATTRQALDEAIAHWRRDLRQASEQLAIETKDAVDLAAVNLSDIEEIVSSVEKASATIESDLQRIETAAKRSAKEFSSAQGTLMTDGDQMLARLREISEEMRLAGDRAQSHLTAITGEGEAALARALTSARTIKADGERIVAATARLGEETDTFRSAIDNRLSALEERLERVRGQMMAAESQMQTLDARASHDGARRFGRAAETIIESLQAAAIDIDRLLANDVSDEHWQKFLKGDRGLFVRRALKLGDRASRRRIRDRYGADSDFRRHVETFLKGFEELMTEVDKVDPKGALSVTLVSSQIGRLYVLLAQTVGRLA
ncbi:MAG: hypothetical protein DCC73_04120 [Proteobacteria bacterium]|nr:MAG: hypothetical protein DCC73_04120 [Pseudomonadota bacterium]